MSLRRSTPISPYLAEVRGLGEALTVLQQKVAALDTISQADFTSVEDGSIDVYDDDGNIRARMGKQPDGSFAVKTFAPKPQTPSDPDVIPVPGGCVVEWDGTFEDVQEEPVQRVAIHVGLTADFAVVTNEDEDSEEDQTEKAAILSPRGGSAFLALDPGQETYYVRLTAVAEGGAESDPTPSVEVIVSAPEAAFYQDEYVLTADGSQTLTLTFTPLDHSDHLYWNGLYQREDIAWTRIGKAVTLLDGTYPPSTGDQVVVEYAYNPGEEPVPVPLAGESAEFVPAGQDSYLYVLHYDDENTDWSVEFLYKLLENPTDRRAVVETSNGVNINRSWSLYVEPSGATFLQVKNRTGDVTQYTFIDTGSVQVLNDHKAHHIVIRYNATTKRISYLIDAVERGAVTLTGSYQSGHNLVVGGSYFFGQPAHCVVDEVACYRKVLSTAEAAEHFEQWSYGGYPTAVLDSGAHTYLKLDNVESAGILFDSATGEADGGDLQGTAVFNSPALQKGE